MFSYCYYQLLSCKCRVGHSPWSHRRIVCGAYGYDYTWSMVYGGPWWSMVYGGPWWSCAQEDKSKGELDLANASLCGNHFSHSCDVARMCMSCRAYQIIESVSINLNACSEELGMVVVVALLVHNSKSTE